MSEFETIDLDPRRCKECRLLIMDYIQKYRFGENKFATFDVVDGVAILRSAHSNRNTAAYLTHGRFFADVERQEVFIFLKLD